jgi:septal ring factor EnvC (AmiA/AmiB activator)
MTSHQSLFNRELQLEESKFMEMQFERRENDAEMSKEAMDQIQAQMEDLRSSNKRTEDQLSAAFEKLNNNLETLSRRTEESRGEREAEARLLSKRIPVRFKFDFGQMLTTLLSDIRVPGVPDQGVDKRSRIYDHPREISGEAHT